MDMFSFTRFCLRVLADLNEIIRRMKRNVILTIAIKPDDLFILFERMNRRNIVFTAVYRCRLVKVLMYILKKWQNFKGNRKTEKDSVTREFYEG